MMGQTHMACGAASAAVAILGWQAGLTFSASLQPNDSGQPNALAGLAATLLHAPSALILGGFLVLGLVASLVPDLDAPNSELQHLPERVARQGGRLLGRRNAAGALIGIALQLVTLPVTALISVLSFAIRRVTGHRGMTHTVWALIASSALAYAVALGASIWTHDALVLPLQVAGVWFVGYASHLAADACTPAGVDIWGSRGKAYHLLPTGWRIRTGTWPDVLVVRWGAWALCAIMVVVLYTGSR